MRINKYLALATGMSRRAADVAIAAGKVKVNGQPATLGQAVAESDQLQYDGQPLNRPSQASLRTIILNKPSGYVVSRDGQGSATVYDLLPKELHELKPVGRLDKYSSGLLLLTNDGSLAFELTHPSRQKHKIYEVRLSRPLEPLHHQLITDHGLMLEDGISKLQLERITDKVDTDWRITMQEGRNRQIRRTFAALSYGVPFLHRTQFGQYRLGSLQSKAYIRLNPDTFTGSVQP